MVKKIVVLFLCLILLAGCSKKQVYEAPELMDPVGVSMDTATVTRKDIYHLKTFTGTVTPEVEVLMFTEDGTVDKVNVVYGDVVKKGDVLATYDQKALNKEVKALEREIETQQTLNDFTNQELEKDLQTAQIYYNMAADYGASGSDLSLAWISVEEAQLALDQAKEDQELAMSYQLRQLDRLQKKQGTGVITAPYDGTITYLNPDTRSGAVVTAYTPVFYIAKDEELCVVCDVISDSLLEHADLVTTDIMGQQFGLIPYPYSDEEYLTMVLSDAPVLSRFHLEGGTMEGIESGDTAVIQIISNTSKDTLVIPAGALFRDDLGRYVFKIEDGHKVRCDVSVGLITGTEAEIVSGLEEGDEVYVQE